ncbi:MAG: FAD-dependent monooxygenase, partial [Pseudomonadota bacterium]
MSIIGAGVGGLTTALALTHRGFDVDVYEATKQVRPISTGIVLSPVALNILNEYCVLEEVLAQGQAVHSFSIRSHRDKCLSRYDVTRFNEDTSPQAIYRQKTHSVAINTTALQRILMSALQANIVHTNKRLSEVDLTNKKIRFGMGDSVEFDGLIGADGFNSLVRGYVTSKERLIDCNQVGWRGASKMGLFYDERTEFVEYWGKGLRFAYVQMSDT